MRISPEPKANRYDDALWDGGTVAGCGCPVWHVAQHPDDLRVKVAAHAFYNAHFGHLTGFIDQYLCLHRTLQTIFLCQAGVGQMLTQVFVEVVKAGVTVGQIGCCGWLNCVRRRRFDLRTHACDVKKNNQNGEIKTVIFHNFRLRMFRAGCLML